MVVVSAEPIQLCAEPLGIVDMCGDSELGEKLRHPDAEVSGVGVSESLNQVKIDVVPRHDLCFELSVSIRPSVLIPADHQ